MGINLTWKTQHCLSPSQFPALGRDISQFMLSHMHTILQVEQQKEMNNSPGKLGWWESRNLFSRHGHVPNLWGLLYYFNSHCPQLLCGCLNLHFYFHPNITHQFTTSKTAYILQIQGTAKSFIQCYLSTCIFLPSEQQKKIKVNQKKRKECQQRNKNKCSKE